MSIAVALSGGVDSLAALLKLREEGHNLIGLHARFINEWEGAIAERLAATLQKLCVPFLLLDLRHAFTEKVREQSFRSWHRGETPNPCALCNRYIKFGEIFDIAMELGCEALATGHYATRVLCEEGCFLARPRDQQKDQTYFLSLISPPRVHQLVFPLADMTKDESRRLVAEAGITLPAPTESQDVCFLPKDESLRRKALINGWKSMGLGNPPTGRIMLCAEKGLPPKEIGSHKGLWLHTEGQRKGLGIPYSEGLYVLAKKGGADQDLLVGPRRLLGMHSLHASCTSFFARKERIHATNFVKVRYRQEAMQARVEVEDGEMLRVIFDTPVFPSAVGQIVSVYSASGLLLAGGIIDAVDCGL